MSLTQIQLLQLNKMADHILHNPANQPTGKQLELAFVVDETSDRTFVLDSSKALAASLRRHDKIFENVRCNIVTWGEEGCGTNVVPMSYVMLGRIVIDEGGGVPKLDELAAYLKMFHARSKCIFVITEGGYQIEDNDKLLTALSPFLKSKLVLVTPEELIPGSRVFMEAVKES